jgi:hypothetical protein
MKTLLRMTSLAALAATALVAAPASAAPTAPTGVTSGSNATATARIIKPLTLVSTANLDFGTLLLSGAGTWTGAAVDLPTSNVIACPTNVTCSGTTSVAKYKVTGTNGQTVTITTPDVVLKNANDATKTLTMTVNSPGTVALGNSGNSGVEFPLGGKITLASDTEDRVYSGNFNDTVDY